MTYYRPIVADGPKQQHSASEQAYRNVWLTDAAPRAANLLSMALVGGLIADRLSWVFIAGYQAACRHAFGNAGFEPTAWLALAASEDRTEPRRWPPVTLDRMSDRMGEGVSDGILKETATDQVLNGTKTWVAAATTVTDLIITVGRGRDTQYFQLDRKRPGLTIEHGGTASFLADLVQGKAHCTEVRVVDADRLQPTAVRDFALIEPLYIYAAFCGLVLGSEPGPDADLVSCSHDCLDAIKPALASLASPEPDRFNLKKADARAQDLLVRLSGNRLGAAGDWEADQRLIAMYSKGFRRLAD